jgi:hypothetical protein
VYERSVRTERFLVVPGLSIVFLCIDPEEIGVLAPYKTQVRAIRELLMLAKLSDISVGSVEQFQGQVRSRLWIGDGQY